ncbi:MAG: sigma-E processing peptidase SpoIIGA [Bacilli bacterium]|nr:sigma-E processing peptidase SpoIIGA [Bacilli bacterium]
MKTIVYLDLVILLTLVINFLFIKMVSILLKEKIKLIRLIIALLISVLSIFLFIVPIKYIYNLRYFIGILIGVVAFKEKKHKLLGISIIYLINLTFIGTLVVFHIQNYWLLIGGALLLIFVYLFEHFYLIINKHNLTYNVVINNQKYIGFLDTGNKIVYKNQLVVFLNSKYYSSEYIYDGNILIDVISGKTCIDIYAGPNLFIDNIKYEVYYSFSDIKYDVLLNSYMGV